MASSGCNENNSQLSSCNDKSISRKHLNEHEETLKSDQMASSKKLSNDSNDEEIAQLNDNELKKLLDEAMTYRNPHDINRKSETFKRLLQNVTEEDERKRNCENNSLWKAQSNSLQDLFDDSHYQSQSHQSQSSNKKHQQRRKNSTSVSARRLEGGSLPIDMHHSAVVQSPPDQPFLSELKNNKKRKERQGGNKDTVIDMADLETDDRSKSFLKCLDSSKDTSSHYDTMIEMKSFSNRSNINDMEVQEQPSSKFTTANSTPNTITTMASMMSTGSPIPSILSSKVSSNTNTNSVDSVIQFSPLMERPKSYQQAQYANTIYAPSSTVVHTNNIVLTDGGSSYSGGSSGSAKIADQALQLPSGQGISSVIDLKYGGYSSNSKFSKTGGGQSRDDVNAMSQPSSSSVLPTSHASTSNSKESKANKKRTAKSERNEKQVTVEQMEGYRGKDPIEDLLFYIEGQNQKEEKNQKSHPKNGIVSNAGDQLLSAEEKKKKLVAKNNKEKINKLKKSNSMDELCSTGRQKENQAAEAAAEAEAQLTTANKIVHHDVTLRSKSSNLTSGAKKSADGGGSSSSNSNNKSEKIQSKRNERRSWGTEGLWPDTATASSSSTNEKTSKDSTHHHEQQQKPQQQQQNENETSSSSSSSGVQLDFATSDSINLTNFESISASNEADKFQVVSKKKKVKRKSNEAPEMTSTAKSSSSSNHMPALRRDGNNLRSGTKYSNENSRNDSNIKSNNNNSNNRNSKPMSQDAKQQNANKSRRKSTSSVPPSEGEDGEYSDGGGSVQSLPIETTKTTSSFLSATAQPPPPPPHTSAENSGKNSKKITLSNPVQQISPSSLLPLPPTQLQQQQQQQQPKSTTFSYADIAKTNTSRTNNNNVIATSTEKWPSISSSSSSIHHHYQHNNNNNQNNVNHSNNISSTNDPFAISNYDAINNINNNSTSSNVNTSSNINNAAAISSNYASQKHQQKSTPTATIISTSFPDLVESNNNRNKQLSNSPLEVMTTSNGDATQTEKHTLNGSERGVLVAGAFDNNNNSSNSTTLITSNSSNVINNADDRLNNNSSSSTTNNQKISYSQSLLESHNYPEIDSNGNSAKLNEANVPATNQPFSSTKNVLTKSKSVDHNNLSSIEHYPALEKTKQTLSDVLSKPIESFSAKSKQKQTNTIKEDAACANSTATALSSNSNNSSIAAPVVLAANANGKRTKKDKLALKKSTSTVCASTVIPTTQSQYSMQNNVNSQQHRPAVIILDDDCEKPNEMELGITFGFDINEHLLFGHQNGDAVTDIDPSVEVNNNSNCDIMNTNLSSNNININNLTINNQSCGFEMYENFIASPQSGVIVVDHSQQMIHQQQNTIIQSSPKNNTSSSAVNHNNTTTAAAATNTILDSSNQSSNDLGYSSILTNSSTSPATANVVCEVLQRDNSQQVDMKDNVRQSNSSNNNNIPIDVKSHMKFEELKMLTLPQFISPEPTTKTYNYEELVTFVSEEWTKMERNGVFFNGLLI